MALANSLWLWALSALAVPLIIHLLSRREGKVIRMGSLRYLQDSNTQQFKSLRLTEIVLFILRCLLIIILVLFLCNLLWPKSTSLKWVIVEERLQNNTTANALKDSLLTQGYELHTLSNDFQLDSKSIGHSYWSLSEHLQSEGIADAIFLSTARATAFKGTRTSKSSLKWITIPTTITNYPLAAIRKSNDSITVINAQLENGNTHYNRSISQSFPTQSSIKINNDSITILANDTLRIALVSSNTFSYDKKVMKALLNVIQQNSFRKIIVNELPETTSIDQQTDWLIWLSEKELPKNVSGSIISFKEKINAPLLQQESSSRWILTTHLDEELILNSTFSTTFDQLLLPETAINQIADNRDERTLPDELMWASSPKQKTATLNTASFISLNHYLIILFLLIWITERIIAYKRNQ